MKARYIFASAILLVACGTAHATVLYADSAPNVYGSPDWAPWWAQTKDDVAAGNFTNMRTGTYPGTTIADPYDEIVYSTMDLGKRLHWIYWLPGETTAGLDGRFQVKWVVDWEGEAWTWDWNAGDWAEDGPEAGWVQPTHWEDYDNGMGTTGVIGNFGFAWWAYDDLAEPYDTGGSPYDETDQADIDALRQQVLAAQTYNLGLVRYRETVDSDWQYDSLRVDIIPEPGTMVLVATGLLGLAGLTRRR